MASIGKRLKDFRQTKGLSVAKISAHIGVSESTYRDWEQGRSIQGEPYPKLAEIFQVGLSELILGESFDNNWIILELQKIEEIVKGVRSRL